MPFALRHVSGSGWVRELVGGDSIAMRVTGGAGARGGLRGGNLRDFVSRPLDTVLAVRYTDGMSESNNTKTIQIDITEAEVIEAQGGVGGSDRRITVTIPHYYDPALITVADVAHDGQIAWEVR